MLFPSIPPAALAQGIHHPSFSPPPETALTPHAFAEPLSNAILSGPESIPPDLLDLRSAVEAMHTAQSSSMPSRRARDNIWSADDLDVTNLRLKDEISPVTIGNAIPDHLRASILRLVETQKEEEVARERAFAEARGTFKPARQDMDDLLDDDDDAPAIKPDHAGDDSDRDQDESSGTNVIPRQPTGEVYDVDQQSLLELAYITNPSIFDRDATTRRSAARKKLRDDSKMDDAQLEGWRVMLDRNPHKDAILARHQFVPAGNREYLPPVSTPSRGDRGRGRGGARGGERGRGRGQSKGSRGHPNAARSRGHDRKMNKMGAGAGTTT